MFGLLTAGNGYNNDGSHYCAWFFQWAFAATAMSYVAFPEIACRARCAQRTVSSQRAVVSVESTRVPGRRSGRRGWPRAGPRVRGDGGVTLYFEPLGSSAERCEHRAVHLSPGPALATATLPYLIVLYTGTMDGTSPRSPWQSMCGCVRESASPARAAWVEWGVCTQGHESVSGRRVPPPRK